MSELFDEEAGAFASPSTTTLVEAPVLPDGYYFDDNSLRSAEFAELWHTAEIGRDVTYGALMEFNQDLRRVKLAKHEVVVRTQAEALIGVGLLIHQGALGEFSDFVVRPEHQGQGIGKAIIDRRLQVAGSLKLHSLYVETLAHTNTLSSYYQQRGFTTFAENDCLGLGLMPTKLLW